MNTRTLGLAVSSAAVGIGLVVVGCARTIDGTPVVNETDRLAHFSSVASSSSAASSSAAAASTSRAATMKTDACAAFTAGVLDVTQKWEVITGILDSGGDWRALQGPSRDWATALSTAAGNIQAVLRTDASITAPWRAPLTEYVDAANGFAAIISSMLLGGASDAFTPAATRYDDATSAAAIACQ
ncbi:hypothetical protein [Nocardia huaxiensis]|uniref:Lipoprotein n=1 Tax=Nocardia huaxiensis TaxID=2755382 RepID=A0A7D6Z2F5_9NOCA|nr:hypothetical protein [Nocardia huaxiensis]QLY31146.1 hypothetical protein H0264_01755 [Nocardia huaxiensis]